MSYYVASGRIAVEVCVNQVVRIAKWGSQRDVYRNESVENAR